MQEVHRVIRDSERGRDSMVFASSIQNTPQSCVGGLIKSGAFCRVDMNLTERGEICISE
jgi:hypothetical protein